MKKLTKKLSLGKETVSELSENQLNQIVGGTGYLYDDYEPIYSPTEACDDSGSFIVY